MFKKSRLRMIGTWDTNVLFSCHKPCSKYLELRLNVGFKCRLTTYITSFILEVSIRTWRLTVAHVHKFELFSYWQFYCYLCGFQLLLIYITSIYVCPKHDEFINVLRIQFILITVLFNFILIWFENEIYIKTKLTAILPKVKYTF